MDTAQAAGELTNLLGLAAPPIAISFSNGAPAGVERFDEPMAEPTERGRTGRVPAGCVFWMKATDRTFTTVAEDHGNCSVGSLTHGFIGLEEAASREDSQAIMECGWVDAEAAAAIPTVRERFSNVTYGPLASFPADPDVVLLRLNGRGLMVLMDAMPGVQVEGKPQCHIVPVAREQGRVVVSAGCALSRARTGMPASEMTCCIPGSQLGDVLGALRRTADVDTTVARYAAADSRRFAPQGP